MLCFEANLTKQEEKARDIMVYLFNPVLKFILMTSNYEEFKRYGFNSCRQTAILGASYLKKLLPDYDFHVYEGHFVEKIDGKATPYDHAFIVAINDKEQRHLVIDLSRTSKKLIFMEAQDNLYPQIEDYQDVIKIGQDLIDLDEMINTDEPEYFTGLKPLVVLKMIDTLIEELKMASKSEQLYFCKHIYKKTTMLGGEVF